MREIGSEFWIGSEPERLLTERDGVYCLSGRTAIDLVLQDILRKRAVRSVAMPAWCCDSMVEPFVAHGIELRFYDVKVRGERLEVREGHTDVKVRGERLEVREGHTDFTDNTDKLDSRFRIQDSGATDIFYLTNYFGYENTVAIETVRRFKERGAVVLYDRTHSLLMEDGAYRDVADYSFASIRKWMGVIGGAVVNGVKDCQLKPCSYLECKEQAMRMKKSFIEGDTSIDKQAFLNLYGEFGHHLAEDYRNYEMDDLSYALYKSEDLSAMRRKRRENAQYLHEHLKGVRFIGELTEGAVPLFVPVFFESREQRDSVRRKLIEQRIYCPIHWPKPTQIPEGMRANEIYDTELSVICDQRYGLAEMERIVTQIARM